MNWDAIGAMGEWAGATAVVATLVYLASQVRQSAADTKASIIHSLHSNEVDIQLKPSTDVILARAVEKAYTGAELNDDERAQFTMWFYSALINFEQVYLEYKRLGVESALFEAQRMRSMTGLGSRLSRAIWLHQKDRFSIGFQDYVESNILELDTDLGDD